MLHQCCRMIYVLTFYLWNQSRSKKREKKRKRTVDTCCTKCWCSKGKGLPSLIMPSSWIYRRYPPGLTEKEHKTASNIDLGPPRGGKWTADERNLGPIKCDETHSKARRIAEQLVDDDVIWGNPTDPREVRKGLEEVSRNEIPDYAGRPSVEEESLSGYTSAVPHTCVRFCMQRVEEGACDEIIRPDWWRGYAHK